MLPYDLHGKRQRTPLFNKGALRVLSIYTYTQPRHDVPPCIRSPRAPSTLCLSLPVPVVDRSKRHHTGETCEDRVSSSGGRGWVPAEPTTRRLNSFALSPGYRPSRTRRLNLNSPSRFVTALPPPLHGAGTTLDFTHILARLSRRRRPLHALCLHPQLAPRSSQAAIVVTHALPPPRALTSFPRPRKSCSRSARRHVFRRAQNPWTLLVSRMV